MIVEVAAVVLASLVIGRFIRVSNEQARRDGYLRAEHDIANFGRKHPAITPLVLVAEIEQKLHRAQPGALWSEKEKERVKP